jgi:hypothetical protein
MQAPTGLVSYVIDACSSQALLQQAWLVRPVLCGCSVLLPALSPYFADIFLLQMTTHFSCNLMMFYQIGLVCLSLFCPMSNAPTIRSASSILVRVSTDPYREDLYLASDDDAPPRPGGSHLRFLLF